MPRIKETKAKKESLFQWLDLPPEQRVPSMWVEKAKELGVTTQTLNNWNKFDYPKWKKNGQIDLATLDHDGMVTLWKKVMVKLVEDGGATAEDRKTFAKYLGLLIDKSEHTLKRGTLDADEYFTIRGEAQRRLGEFHRARGLQSRPALLPEEIRDGAGQTSGDNPV